MGFRKDKTTVAQTAANNAGNIVAALATAGIVKTAAAAQKAFDELYGGFYGPLAEVVDADNEMFAEQEKADAKSGGGRSSSRSGGSRKGGSGGSAAPSLQDSLDMVLNFGAFKTLTLSEVLDLDAEGAQEYGYGEGDKTGRQYVEWLAKNTDPKAKYAATRAAVIVESQRAESDAA